MGMDGPADRLSSRPPAAIVRAACANSSEMVDDLLDLAKVDAGRISISPEWFDMVDLFSALRGMFKPILGSGSCCPDIRGERQTIPRIYTDDKKLSQILRNFISNALKFTPRAKCA